MEESAAQQARAASGCSWTIDGWPRAAQESASAQAQVLRVREDEDRCRRGGRDGDQGGGRLEDQGEPEDGTGAGAARDGDVAAHALGQTARDGQAEARATVAARGGRIGLSEGLEEIADLVGGDSDARVAHLDLDAASAVVERDRVAHVERDASVVGELHRVSDQV